MDSYARPRVDFHLHAAHPVMAGELILIVEDNEKNRKLERDILQFHGYRTVEADTAEELIRLAQAAARNLTGKCFNDKRVQERGLETDKAWLAAHQARRRGRNRAI